VTDKPTIVEALAAVMEDVRAVRKGDRNTAPGQNYMFRGIDAVMNAAGPALRKHGVIVVPMCESATYRDVQTSTGKPSRECTVTVRYRFHGPAGDSIDCVVPGESMDSGDKGTAKAMSVAFRIALLQALCLPTDDADPDSQTYERGEPVQRQRPAQTAERRPSAATEAMRGDPEKMRAALEATCTENGWDFVVVRKRFLAENGMALRDCTDAVAIAKFRSSLSGVPQMELMAPATNGAAK
jgi:hypothetical protein